MIWDTLNNNITKTLPRAMSCKYDLLSHYLIPRCTCAEFVWLVVSLYDTPLHWCCVCVTCCLIVWYPTALVLCLCDLLSHCMISRCTDVVLMWLVVSLYDTLMHCARLDSFVWHFLLPSTLIHLCWVFVTCLIVWRSHNLV